MTESPETEARALIAFTQWMENLRTDVSQSVNGVLLRGARPVPVGTAENATKRPTTAAGALAGYALRNTSDSADATVLLRDGDANGDVLIPVTLAPNESARDWFGPGGINLSEGLHVEVAAGTIDGAVFLVGGGLS